MQNSTFQWKQISNSLKNNTAITPEILAEFQAISVNCSKPSLGSE